MQPNQRLTHGLARCPRCSEALAAPFSAAGRPARCNTCGCRFLLPPADELFEDAVSFVVEHEDATVPDEIDQTAHQLKVDLITNCHAD